MVMAPMKRAYHETSSLSDSSSSSDEDSYKPASFQTQFAEPPAKKVAVSSATLDSYSEKSMRMMQKMGYKVDEGLGKSGQGRLEPVEASNQKGRRGLGMRLDGLDTAALEWNPSMENIQLKEPVEWLYDYSDDLENLNQDDLDNWLRVGPKKMTIDDETKFCDPEILDGVIKQKTIFDDLGADDMRNARTRSNPFETIRGSIFINRAAMKMANIDSIFDKMFSSPVDEQGNPLVRGNDLLYFADVCAGPGGFSEYVLWRKKWHAKGFGFTLRAENDFKLHDFFAGHPETFDAYYGKKGDGNVYDPENISSYADYVLKQTESGVHFMMSDGGFSVEGHENVQEILSKQLYLCQCLVALSIVRENGHFVTKLFDVFTPFSVGLVYLMYKCFKQVCIVKPNTSRPANSERYLVCKWKKANTDSIRKHLFEVNKAMWQNKDSSLDTLELVSHEVLTQDEKFFNYIYESNNAIGQNQITGLLKIAAFCKDSTLRETRQADIQRDCLNIWQIPNQMRKAPTKKSTDHLFTELLAGWFPQKDFLSSNEKPLTAGTSLKKLFVDFNDWYFMPLDVVENSGKNVRTFFMSKGNRDVYKYTENRSWVQVTDVCIEMSPNSFIYGEIAKELQGEGRSQTVVHALHIIDGMVLGGIDIRNHPLPKRLKMCEKFASALNKPNKIVMDRDGQSPITLAPIRCKRLFSLLDLRSFFGRLHSFKLKDGKTRLGLPLRNSTEPGRFFVPRGLLMFNVLKSNLRRHMDKAKNRPFYIDLAAKNKSFVIEDLPNPDLIFASFKSTFVARHLWKWEIAPQVEETTEESSRLDGLLYRVDLEQFIYSD